MNIYHVTREFDTFLKRENLSGYKDRIDSILEIYRERPGGLIPVLQQVQEHIKYLPPVVQHYIAMGLGVPSSDVYGVVSFYSFFTMKPRGRHLVRACLGTACYVKGIQRVIDKIETGFNLKMGGTSEDRRFTLQGVRCLGACGLAPVVMVDDDTLGEVDPSKIVKLLEKYE
ncbi:MAG: NAD(P)H-dependent oxidoreductase subunit E [Spirochaetes bacterium]|nr:NAD(P)H-dependent oxidoreductase subunit E [Spirochaetota bacterium]